MTKHDEDHNRPGQVWLSHLAITGWPQHRLCEQRVLHGPPVEAPQAPRVLVHVLDLNPVLSLGSELHCTALDP